MNALVRPLPERELLIEDQTADLWAALEACDVAKLMSKLYPPAVEIPSQEERDEYHRSYEFKARMREENP